MAMAPGNGSPPERRHSKVRRWVVNWWRAVVSARAGSGKFLVNGFPTLKRRLALIRSRYMLLLFVACIALLFWYIHRRFPEWHLHIAVVLWENLFPVSILLVVLLSLLLRWFLWQLPKQQVEGIDDEKDRLTAESGFRQPLIQIVQTLVQIVGGTALLGGLYFTAQTLRTSQETLRVNQKTLETTQQGQITERFSKAIEQLGSDNLAIRLGGIYALERIARDSAYDHWTVMEVLTAYVREHAPWPPKPPKDMQQQQDNPLSKGAPPAAQSRLLPDLPQRDTDIQTVLTVLGRRTQSYETREDQVLDLRETDLRLADLAGAHLARANLARASLERAQLPRASLARAHLWRASLVRANLHGAHLERAMLAEAHLEVANLVEAQLEGADLRDAHLEGAALVRTHLEKADLPGAQMDQAFLAEAQLEGANLAGAQLEEAILVGAHLEGATLIGVQLKGADLRGAQMKGADLRRAQMKGAQSLTLEQLSLVKTLYQ